MLQGTSADLGDFQECLDVRYEPSNQPANGFQGKYCLLTLRPLLPIKPTRLTSNQLLLNFSSTPIKGSAFDEYSQSISHFYSATSFNFGICTPSTCSKLE